MEAKVVVVPVMQKHEYRDPKTFKHNYIDHWREFLERWNDPDVTIDEAKGLLHGVTRMLGYVEEWPERIGEDPRETCVRFLLHYADHPYRSDNEWQIVEKAQQVLLSKVIDTAYVEKTPTDKLLLAILYSLWSSAESALLWRQPAQRKLASFLKKVAVRKDPEMQMCVNNLRNRLLDTMAVISKSQ